MATSLFDAFVRSSQYLAIIPLDKNAFFEAPAIMVRFFDATTAFLITTHKNDSKSISHLLGSVPVTTDELMSSFENSAQDVMETGYFDTHTQTFAGNEYGFILLPLESENIIKTLLVVGFAGVVDFPKDELNTYIAVSSLISSTYQKQIVVSKNKMILEMAGEGIFGLDKDGRHTFVNEAAARMLGFGVHELLGKNAHKMWHHHYPDGQEYDEQDCPIFGVLNGRSGETKGEEYFLRKDGGSFEVEFVATPIHEEGEISGVVVVFGDITERKRLERELIQINDQLEKRVQQEVQARQKQELLMMQQSKMAMMGEMIGAIAHQWRQPLNSLGLTVQDVHAAYKYGELDEEYILKFQTDAMSVIQRMSKTIDDFRNYFRPNKQAQEFALENAIEQTINLVLPQLNNNFIAVKFNKNGEHMVYGYKNEIEQAILIIISNAKDALLDNKIPNPKMEIFVSSDQEGKVVLIIEDNGGGVPEEIMDRIFEPYFTTKEQGKGVGIGLYMAKEIIERQMHGKIRVENTGVGARFVIEL
jgi:two-component system, LuxR family, sensor kinase FixL